MKGIRDALKTALAAVLPLAAAYDTVPDTIQLPCAFVKPARGRYHETFVSSKLTHFMEVTVLLARGGVLDERQDTMDDLLEPTGSGSLLAAIEAASFEAHADYAIVRGYRDYGGLQFGEQTYLGFKLDVEVVV